VRAHLFLGLPFIVEKMNAGRGVAKAIAIPVGQPFFRRTSKKSKI
jgi:hypothetical protein